MEKMMIMIQEIKSHSRILFKSVFYALVLVCSLPVQSTLAVLSESGQEDIRQQAGEEEINDNECEICFQALQETEFTRLLPCNHHKKYHKECVENWLKISARCPLCKNPSKFVGYQELNENEQRLLLAAKQNQTEVIQQLLNEGTCVNVRNQNGCTPLMVAVYYNQRQAVEVLIKNAAAFDITHKINRQDALLLACCYANEQIGLRLLEAGAQPNVVDLADYTPLMMAVKRDQKKLVAALIEKKADVNYLSFNGSSPISLAFNHTDNTLLKMLLDAHAHPDIRYSDGSTPLMWAAKGQNISRMALLLHAGAEVDAHDEEGKTSLHWALERGDVAVKMLILAGARINRQTHQGLTPLMLALYRYSNIVNSCGNENTYYRSNFHTLLKAKADTESKGKSERFSGYTALHIAAHLGESCLMNYLLEAGADIIALSCNGLTPLMIARLSVRDEQLNQKRLACTALLSKHAQGNPEETTLRHTVYSDIISVLLKAGAVLNYTQLIQSRHSHERQQAIGYLFTELYGCHRDQGNEIDIIKRLLKHNAYKKARDCNGNTVLMLAIQANQPTLVELFLKEKVDKEAKNNNGDTPLMEAARRGSLECVSLLLKHGACKEVANTKGETPLIAAIEGGHREIVALLLKEGMCVDGEGKTREECGMMTPLMIAARNGNEDMVSLLLQQKAYIGWRNNQGDDALSCAMQHDHLNIVLTLLRWGAHRDSLSDFRHLHYAAQHGHKEVFDLMAGTLNTRGSNTVNHRNAHNDLYNIRMAGPAAMKDRNGCTPFMLAARNGHTEIMQLLKNVFYSGEGLDGWDNTMWTALIAASHKGHAYVVDFLLKDDAEPYYIYARDLENNTALMHAAVQGHKKIIESLLKAQAALMTHTPLFQAVVEGNKLSAAALLRDSQTELNVCDQNGDTALMYAIYLGDADMVELLLTHPGMPRGYYNRAGFNALQLALTLGHTPIAALLGLHNEID